MMQKQLNGLVWGSGLLVALGMWGSVAMAQIVVGPTPAATGAGNVEPPSSAVDESGNPTASTPTQPSWDQRLRTDNGDANGCNSTRFKCIWPEPPLNTTGVAVLDKNTGMVWERSPQTTTHTWGEAKFQCLGRGVGGQRGWRLPSIHELNSLVVPGNPAGGPDLPVGHPFRNVQSSDYWSATTESEALSLAGFVNFNGGLVSTNFKTSSFLLVWCVRGGSPGPSAY